MPFISVKTNVKLSDGKREAVKAALGGAITAVPGKSEGWLMVGIEDDHKLYFKGTPDPAAMVEVSLYGSASSAALNKLTESVTKIIGENAGVPADRIYVSYMCTNDWGWNGSNF